MFIIYNDHLAVRPALRVRVGLGAEDGWCRRRGPA